MITGNMRIKLPWKEPPLNDWTICEMNHYIENGELKLYVCMCKDNLAIRSEGPDCLELWKDLREQALSEGNTSCTLTIYGQ